MPNHETIYAQNAETYELLVSRQPSLAPHIEAIRPFDGLDVVDLGAGTGRLATVLAPKAKSLVLLDASQAMLNVAADKLRRTGAAAWRTAVADHRSLPLADRSADLIAAGWTICYLTNDGVPDWETNVSRIIGEMERVLRPGGTIVIFETMGTGAETPCAPGFLRPYYSLLTETYRFSHKTVRLDYAFDSVRQAEELAGFFFGADMAERVRANRWSRVPEWAGMWWKHV
ncbi:class I SAM-dependent methyltransferase [Paenibacillus sp. GYB003]|uniref:class I SAM-dependent methyltransferase n=1 Tax=Paenibacillus sp. GYB003 TaxID=2994392 RepID=UPI002F9647E5